MRRYVLWLLLLAVLSAFVGAGGEAWDADRAIHCRDHLPGCRLLQMVMTGSFDRLDPEDALSTRVLASAWPRLREITEADIDHFSQEFDEAPKAVRLRWYGALAACLRADIAQAPQPAPERRVLALFLDPDGDEAERSEIRGEMTDAILERIAGSLEAPVEFVRWVIWGGE